MIPTLPVLLRRPLTPVLERGEYSPSPPVSEPACTFDPSTAMPIPDPEITNEVFTSSQADHVNECLTNQMVYGDVSEIVKEMIRDSPRAKFPMGALQNLCEVYAETRRAIDRVEWDLVKMKKRLKKASDDFARNHKRVTSSTNRHRQEKGLREVADEKTAKWRQHCRNLELGYCQERPQLEQMKTVLNIFKVSVSELEQSNKYLTTFMDVMKKRHLKLFEQQRLEHIRNKPARKTCQDFSQEFEDALRNELDIRNIGNPSYRQYTNHHELMKKFGRNLPRPPFAPLNVFKLNSLSSYVGKSSVRYGGGQVFTLKVEHNNQLLGDEGTFGRVSPEAKETCKYTNHHELMKKFGQNLPRPPFAPRNVSKLNSLSSYVGKPSVRYGNGQVCTLKIDLKKQLLGDEGTFGRVSPEAKVNWVLAGKKCQKREMEADVHIGEGRRGHSRLPSIGAKPAPDPFKTWMPRKSIVRHFQSSPDTTQVNPNGFRGMKYSTSNTLLGNEWRKRSSAFLRSPSTWGDGNVTEQVNATVSEPQNSFIGCHLSD